MTGQNQQLESKKQVNKIKIKIVIKNTDHTLNRVKVKNKNIEIKNSPLKKA